MKQQEWDQILYFYLDTRTSFKSMLVSLHFTKKHFTTENFRHNKKTDFLSRKVGILKLLK